MGCGRGVGGSGSLLAAWVGAVESWFGGLVGWKPHSVQPTLFNLPALEEAEVACGYQLGGGRARRYKAMTSQGLGE